MRRSRPLLGTFVEITIPEADGPDRDLLATAMEAAFEAVAKVQRLMSFHDSGSELSAINASPCGSVLRVDPWTVNVLRLALDLCEATSGAFDCGIGDVLVSMGELPDHGGRARAGEAEPPSIRDIEVLDDRHVRIRRRACLDLGGIAKGFAVDMAVEALHARGVVSAVVNAGGDLRVLGAEPQAIHVRSVDASPSLRYLGSMADGAVATSVIGAVPGRCRGALIDPRSRRRLAGQRSVTVLAPTCAVADGLTKALAVTGMLDPACLQRYDAVPLVA